MQADRGSASAPNTSFFLRAEEQQPADITYADQKIGVMGGLS
jgi:hypothetical protein